MLSYVIGGVSSRVQNVLENGEIEREDRREKSERNRQRKTVRK